jgi:hypothetical protein
MGWTIELKLGLKGRYVDEIHAQWNRLKALHDKGIHELTNVVKNMEFSNCGLRYKVEACRKVAEALRTDKLGPSLELRSLYQHCSWAHHASSENHYSFTTVNESHMDELVHNLRMVVDDIEAKLSSSNKCNDDIYSLAGALGGLSLGSGELYFLACSAVFHAPNFKGRSPKCSGCR